MKQQIQNEEREIHQLMSVLMPLIETGNFPLALQYIEEKEIPYWRFGLTLLLIQANESTTLRRKMQFASRLIEHAAINTEYCVFTPSRN